MSLRTIISTLLGLVVLMLTTEALAAELHRYLAGYSYQYAYGSGVSSSRPRVTLFVQYCPDGRYYSSGQSCRPNLYASGYQCSSVEDQGQWRADGSWVAWRSISGEQGQLQLMLQPNGSVTDLNGNPLVRLGPARCP